jgi:hypothetical protein
MTCSPCVEAGISLEAMITDLEQEFPGKIRFFQFGYSSSYTCSTMISFKDSNNFHSVPFSDGSHIFPYYGGFGMPTIAVDAGTNHDILFSDVGFLNTDTTQISIAIRNFFAHLSVNNISKTGINILSYPNPATNFLTLQMNLIRNSNVHIQVFDLNGKFVKDILNENLQSGISEKNIDISSLDNGLYMMKINADGRSEYQKLSISH